MPLPIYFTIARPPYLFAKLRICAVQMSLISGNEKFDTTPLSPFLTTEVLHC